MAAVKPIKLAVVGHTNVGKTSLIRTLLQDPGFGEVAARPGTTREVTQVPVLLNGTPVLELYDTPGLEDGEGLYSVLDKITGYRQGPAQLQAFLGLPEAADEFEQEAKVLRQLLHSDAAFYVIDSRDPILPRLKDELDIIRRCGKPVMPILNFVAAPDQQARAWHQALADVNLHGWVEFDTCSLPDQGEAELLTTLQALLPNQRSALQQLIAVRQREREAQRQAGCRQVAELLLDAAAARCWATGSDQAAVAEAETRLKSQLRQAEQQCLRQIIAVYGFTPAAVDLPELKLTAGQWEEELFAGETWRRFGITASKGVVSGGAAGAAFDVATGGLSLGAGTILGATAGGLWQGWRRYGKRLQQRWQGQLPVAAEEAVLHLLAVRQLAVIQALSRRGHGATEPLKLQELGQELVDREFRALLKQARQEPGWSSLNGGLDLSAAGRERWMSAASQRLVEVVSKGQKNISAA